MIHISPSCHQNNLYLFIIYYYCQHIYYFSIRNNLSLFLCNNYYVRCQQYVNGFVRFVAFEINTLLLFTQVPWLHNWSVSGWFVMTYLFEIFIRRAEGKIFALGLKNVPRPQQTSCSNQLSYLGWGNKRLYFISFLVQFLLFSGGIRYNQVNCLIVHAGTGMIYIKPKV